MPRKDADLQDILRDISLFASLDDRCVARLAKGAEQMDVRPRTVLYTPGQEAESMYVVLDGRVKLSLPQPNAPEKVVALVSPGQTFGEAAMFVDSPHMLCAESLSAARLIRICRPAVLDCVKRDREFTNAMLATLSRRLRELMREIELSTAHSATERVVEFLLGEVPPSVVSGPATITLPAKKRIIASRLNVTHEHFSRILRELAEMGAIAMHGREIRVTDVKKLRSIS